MSILAHSIRVIVPTTLVLLILSRNSCLQAAGNAQPVAEVRQLTILKSRVNWEDGTVTLGVESPQELGSALDRDGKPTELLRISASSKKSAQGKPLYTITAPIKQFLTAAGLDTRSLWFSGRQADSRLRLDLPTPEITGLTVVKEAQAEKGPKIRLTVSGLLPEYRVLHQSQSRDAEAEVQPATMPQNVLAQEEGTLPRLVSTSDAPEGSYYVLVQLAASTEKPTAYSFCILNPDGSRSRTLSIVQHGAQIDRTVEKPFAARSTPVDAPAMVPNVELLSVKQALLQANLAGLQPVLVNLQTLRELLVEGQDDAIVTRQGLSSGEQVRQGELLLLGIGKADASNAVENIETTFGAVEGTPPIETDSEFGVAVQANSRGPIDFEPDREFQPVDGELNSKPDQNIEVPDGESPPPLDFTPDVEFGVGSEPRPDNIDPDNPLTSWNPDPGSNGGIMMPLPSQPSVILTPQAPPQSILLNGILRQVLQKILSRFGMQQLPGPIGQAIRDAVNRYESAVTEGLALQASVVDLPVVEILDLTCQHLAVNLSPEQREAAVRDWQAYAALRAHPDYLDENANGLVTDDIVIWFINWLQQYQSYNLAQQLCITTNNHGQFCAVMPRKAIDPNWMNSPSVTGLLKGKMNGNGPQPSKPGQGQSSSGPSQTASVIPEGPAVITVNVHPDLVRVPVLAEQSMQQAKQKLAAVGLKTEPKQKTLPDDRVLSSRPQENSWVKPQTTVSLEIVRRVPNVVGNQSQAAAEMLRGLEFVPKPNRVAKYRSDDIVIGQNPAASTYAGRLTEVNLDVQRRVPNIVGLSAAQAQELIVKTGFRIEQTEGTVAYDIVVQQQPAATEQGKPAYAQPGDVVRIVRVDTLVPDLQGTSLANAKTLSEAKPLIAKVGLGWKIVGPTTNYPEAKVLSQSPLPKQRIDRSREQIALEFVIPVPDLTKRYTVGKAERILTELELKPKIANEDYRSTDVVLTQQIIGRKHVVGKDVYCFAGSVIQLTVGRSVPDVTQLDWESAITRLNHAGFQHDRNSGKPGATHVMASSPAAGQIADPQQAVKLQPGIQMPDLRNDRIEDAVVLVQSKGWKVNVVPGGEVEAPSLDLIGVSLVRDQSFSPGRILPMSSSIVVGLQTVKYVEPRVPVPQLVGMHPEQAQNVAQSHRLQLQSSNGSVVPTADPRLDGQYVVTNQSPRPGTSVPVGATIAVQVGQYELRLQVPNFVGLDPQRAQQVAAHAGLEMQVVRQVPLPANRIFVEGPQFGHAEVVSQNFRPGTAVPRGTTIGVVIGQQTPASQPRGTGVGVVVGQTHPAVPQNPHPNGFRHPLSETPNRPMGSGIGGFF
jgi:beta-lactam-binding protein with PASTA domain